MEKIIRHLKKSENVLLISHVNPDGDAVGSLLAMGFALEALNKNTMLYNESKIPAVYRFLPGVERIFSKSENRKIERFYDTAIILDCGDLQRIGDADLDIPPFVKESNIPPFVKRRHEFSRSDADFKFQVSAVINIDHHITNTRFGDLNLVDPSACATAEIVCSLIKAMAVPIDKSIATCIYTGIFTDTGSFRFSNTNKAAFEICDEMVGLGVDPYNVAKNVYGRYSLGRIKLLNLALDSIEISDNGKLSLMTVTADMLKETGTQPEDTDGLINYARWIEDVKMAVLIEEDRNGERKNKSLAPHKFNVSLRSDGSVDVAAIASHFGGGGHPTAAGFSIEASSITALRNEMLMLAEEIED